MPRRSGPPALTPTRINATEYAASPIPPLLDSAPEFRTFREIHVEEGVSHFENVEILTGELFGRVVMHPKGNPVCGVRVKAWLPSKKPDYFNMFIES